jgi:Lipocalin-like domain
MRTPYFFSIRNLFFCFIIPGFLASCKKEKADTCARTVASIAGTYKVASVKYKASATAAEEDYYALMDACEKDDLVDLEVNGNYTYRDEGVTCSPSGTYSGTWGITANVIISDGIIAGTIQGYDCQNLIVYTTDVIIPGDRITLTIAKQ